MIDAIRNIRNAYKSVPRATILASIVFGLVAVVGYLAYKRFIEQRLSSDFIFWAKVALAAVAFAVAATPVLIRMVRRGSVWSPKELSPSGLPPAPDIIVGVVGILGCVIWFLVRDVFMLNLFMPLCLLIGGSTYLGSRDKFVRPPRKGPRRSPLEQLQEWDHDGGGF